MANIVTLLRIGAALLLLVPAPMSWAFLSLYALCGVTDILDGYLARRTKNQSDFGAFLDTCADVVFLSCALWQLVPMLAIPMWLWGVFALVLGLRLASYAIGFVKFQQFASLHTWGNKATGLLLFVSPLLYLFLSIEIIGCLVTILAVASAVEELGIVARSTTLDKNIRSFRDLK
ncbi:MAG: CDP-alcohol phosphatidyltransferase family protein [Lactobacillus sp.]|nr:CDP-alcohol phosphatidyltransferase family protein [Lactobacillus sp.]